VTPDANGNRTTVTSDSSSSTHTTDVDNQLLSDGTYRYSYDAEGNRIAKFIDADANGVLDAGETDITTYTWDYRKTSCLQETKTKIRYAVSSLPPDSNVNTADGASRTHPTTQ